MADAARVPSPIDKPFSLRTLIRDVSGVSAQADPGPLTIEVLALIPDKHLRSVLAQLLPTYIASVLRGDRNDNRAAAMDVEQPNLTAVANRTVPGRSWAQRAQSSEAWRNRLGDRIHVSAGWKFLRDCTADDLLAACFERRDHAAATSLIADEYERLAKTVAEHGAATVADLPPDVQRAALSGGL